MWKKTRLRSPDCVLGAHSTTGILSKRLLSGKQISSSLHTSLTSFKTILQLLRLHQSSDFLGFYI